MKTVLKTVQWVVALLVLILWVPPTVYEYYCDATRIEYQKPQQEFWEFDPQTDEPLHPLRHLEFLTAVLLPPYLLWCWCNGRRGGKKGGGL